MKTSEIKKTDFAAPNSPDKAFTVFYDNFVKWAKNSGVDTSKIDESHLQTIAANALINAINVDIDYLIEDDMSDLLDHFSSIGAYTEE
jgi:hypothetical protein